MAQDFFRKVYDVVRKIPKGKVATYGQLAEMIGTRDARKVGFALHANSDPKTPCHRVVNKDGRLAPNFAFDGPREQKRRLEAEGVKFKDDMHVDLQACIWQIDIY
ncbi:cysteine methyltransferase [Candidatus Woesebacteria bacterium RBG_16_39_8b]|uniref:Cysteine methyltransferase n=1 Tax=Candidatus Woesebacteria bacterium RBG_16_39_8b TaxID=1802482 RepID=A0A1F7X817_9BACT|nr:MAG: cysteine methyltransferase [Candidatus Woesebacteria bacterium RBG_16_39_8b]